ncbi:unnamed protein product [Caenorhabditis nigoni]
MMGFERKFSHELDDGLDEEEDEETNQDMDVDSVQFSEHFRPLDIHEYQDQLFGNDAEMDDKGCERDEMDSEEDEEELPGPSGFVGSNGSQIPRVLRKRLIKKTPTRTETKPSLAKQNRKGKKTTR